MIKLEQQISQQLKRFGITNMVREFYWSHTSEDTRSWTKIASVADRDCSH